MIYIIDDDKTELACWNSLAPEFETFNNFDALKAALKEEVPDMVVIDYVMPIHSGIEVNQYIKNNYPTVKRVICSGMTDPEFQLLAESTGAKFISKELEFNDRLEVLRAYQS